MVRTSTFIENFIKAIYQLEQKVDRNPKPGTVAKTLNVINAAATNMAHKLSDKNLIHYKK